MSDWIQEIPTVRLTQEQVVESVCCSVCREDFRESECVSKLACDHVFHTQCILTWLEHESTCPICRRDFQVNGNTVELNPFDEGNVENIITISSSEENYLDDEEEWFEEPMSEPEIMSFSWEFSNSEGSTDISFLESLPSPSSSIFSLISNLSCTSFTSDDSDIQPP